MTSFEPGPVGIIINIKLKTGTCITVKRKAGSVLSVVFISKFAQRLISVRFYEFHNVYQRFFKVQCF